MMHSDSQWVTFVDSDDWIHRKYLEQLLGAACTHNVKIAAGGFCRASVLQRDADFPETESLCVDSQQAYCNCYSLIMTAWGKLYHRDLLPNIRFPVGKLHEDCYVTHIPLFEAEKVAVCDVPLYYYFTNPGSITRVKWTEKRLQELEAHEDRAAWLKAHGYDMAYRRETEVYVMTIYEHAEVLAKLSLEDKTYIPYLKHIRNKLFMELKKAKNMGLYTFEREYLWMYLMAYPLLPVWYGGQWLRNMRNQSRSLE